MKKRSFKRQFPVNLISNFVYFVFSLFIGIWFTPYLIKHLGIAVYGLIPLAMAVNEYLAIVTSSFNSAIARFLTIDLHKNDEVGANKVFNTSLWSSLVFVILILPVIISGAYFSSKIFSIPVGQEYDSQVFFMVMAGMFCIYAIGSNFSVSSFALNRFDLRNIIRCSDVAVRALIIVLLFSLWNGKLWFVGIAYLCGALTALIGSIYIWRILTPKLKISFRSFDKSRLSSITHMSGWVLLDQIGAVLFLSSELILVNKLCGSEAAGKYAVILPWVLLLRALVDIVSSALTPMYFTYYARGEIENIIMLLKKSIGFLGLIIALPIGLICGFASSLLSVWIGSSFAELAPLMWLLVGHLIFSLAIMPVFAVQVTFNKVRVPALVTLFMGIGQIVLAVFLVRGLGWGIYGIAFSAASIYLLRNISFSSVYVARILKTKLYTCLVSAMPGVVSMFIVFGVSVFLNYFFRPANWLSLLFFFMMIRLIYLIVVIRFIFKSDDKELFLSIIPVKW
jgi:membrane protein EpsK